MNMSENDIVYFAKTNFRNQEVAFGIKLADRRQHMYVVGKTGTGKTNLIKNLAIQDIQSGRGLAVVDPHGEFVEELLEYVPEWRKDDVVYFNPADTSYPIGFNVLEIPDPQYKHLIASGLMGIFTKIWANVWSARMEYILNNCVLALLDTPGSTLLGIQRILIDKSYRQYIINNLQDPVVKSFWINEFEGYSDRLRSEAIAPIQNKVGQFLSSSLIRNIVGQPKSTLKIKEIMNQQKILLVNVSKGRVGEDNSALLGAMIITKIQLEAMERIRVPEEERKDFNLYVDEFQNFATDSFAGILSEARKYRLNLVVAHQYIGQLVTDITTKVRDAIFGNVGTMIIFRVGAADAEFLEKELAPEFNIDDLVGLPNYEIYLKLMIDGISSKPFSAKTLPPLLKPAQVSIREEIVNASRRKFSRNALLVEEEINASMSSMERFERSPRFDAASEQERVFAPRDEQRYQLKAQPRREPTVNKFPDALGAIGIEFENQGNKDARQKQTSQQEFVDYVPKNNQTPQYQRQSAQPPQAAAAPYSQASQAPKEQYASQCWVCKKPTLVPFPPDGINPVYCRSCMRGIKQGYIEPLPPKDIPKKPIPKWKEEETRRKIAESEARKSKTLQEAMQKGTARVIDNSRREKTIKESPEEEIKQALEDALKKP